jgi:hypothetical protein
MKNTCPKCLTETGVSMERITRESENAEDIAHIPEGLAAITVMQCRSCCYEWHNVSHSHVLQSLRLWNAPLPTGRS